MRQIAVGKMQLQPFKTGIAGTFRGSDKIGHHTLDIGFGHFFRHFRQVFAECDCGWRNGCPATRIAFSNMIVPFPGQIGAGFTACVTDLDPRYCACGFDGFGNLRQFSSLFIVPDPETSRGDTPFRRNRCRFDNHQARAAACQRGVMHLMPVIRHAISGGILAHRRNGDAVF
ncbi:hypothetical protein SRABI106_04039 [Rahnella aquatilis]|nr:hypothetical protein SRABI106_04039 [Rahnella aquatilis]